MSSSVRIDRNTHDTLKRLAEDMHTTEGQVVAMAVRALVQARIGADLGNDLSGEEAAWLDATLG
jgi:predicted transcriptional regulator